MEEKDKNLVQETSENATLTEQMEEEREFLSDKAKIMSPGRLVAKKVFPLQAVGNRFGNTYRALRIEFCRTVVYGISLQRNRPESRQYKIYDGIC